MGWGECACCECAALLEATQSVGTDGLRRLLDMCVPSRPLFHSLSSTRGTKLSALYKAVCQCTMRLHTHEARVRSPACMYLQCLHADGSRYPATPPPCARRRAPRRRRGPRAHQQPYPTPGVRRGEEVTHCYDERYERPDFALINSFFLPDREDRVAAVDLPGGALARGADAANDMELFPAFALESEEARLAARLAAFPTSEAEDAALLRAARRGWGGGLGGGLGLGRPPVDAVTARIVEFRARRKAALARMLRALRERRDRIRRTLAAAGSAARGRELLR